MNADQKAEKILDFFVTAANTIKGKIKSKKLMAMVKSIPNKLEGSVKFPTTEEQSK